MMKFFKNFGSKGTAEQDQAAEQPNATSSLFSTLKNSLQSTRAKLGSQIANFFLGKKVIDAEILAELESILISADVGVATSKKIISKLTEMVARKDLADPEKLYAQLKTELTQILQPCQHTLTIPSNLGQPFVILMVGVNGAGKTTTIGKLAKLLQDQGKKVLIAAGDTFRAAAIEQLKAWGERNSVQVVSQHTGADSAAVVFDALQSATAKQYDVLIADTAGRLHSKDNLMEELKKVSRVLKKLDAAAPHEVLLVLDASLGQNALAQAEKFQQELGVTGIVLSKLDGTAKGGILFAIANKLGLPFRYIGVGEGIADLRPFVAEEFIHALFAAE